MSSRWSDRLRRTLGFRLALWYAIIFVVSSLAVTALTYVLLASSLEQRDREIVENSLAEYARAYRESLQWTLDPANRAAAIAQLAAEFSLAPELAESTYTALADRSDGLFPDARIDVPGIRAVLALRVEAGLLPDPPPDPAKYYKES